jgi:tagatose 6-phosphate kinase
MLVVCPNLSLDESVSVPNLNVGTIRRVDSILRLAGGKGANVARAMRVLGTDALLIGFAGGAPGELLARYLDSDNIAHVLVPVRGDTRTCFTIADEQSGKQTELYGAGPEVNAQEVDSLLHAVGEHLKGHRWMIVTGSPPPAARVDLYADIIRLAKRHGVRTLIDANGPALEAGIAAAPDIVKVNAQELGGATGTQPSTPREVAAAAERLFKSGVGAALITLGSEGAVLVAQDIRRHVRSPRRKVVSPVGSGDAAAAAMLVALDRGDGLELAARAAVAAGTANAMHLGAGRFTWAEYEEILAQCDPVPLA